MYSLNVPVPPAVSKLARGLAAETFGSSVRDRHTLVVKRLGEKSPERLAPEVRDVVAGTAPFQLRIDGIGSFAEPTTGRSPVVYLRVDSPALEALHRRLCDRFGAIDGLEGDEYVPHVTIARGGNADRLIGRDVTTEWTVDWLVLWTGRYDEPVERISLPA